jgi:hypothetical protein
VLIVGDHPGDGKVKPVSFPPPEAVRQFGEEGLPYLDLRTLLELKIASGMTAAHRPRDLDDAIQLIRINGLRPEFGERLDPYVQGKFDELWNAAQVTEEY